MVLKSVSGWLLGAWLAVAGLTGVAATPSEPPRPSKWWLEAESRAAVGITDRQSAEIERIFQSMIGDLRAERARLERHEKDLSRLLDTDGIDEAAVILAIDRVEAARSALAKTRTLMLYRMRRVLSPEQRVRLDDYHKQQERPADETRRHRRF